MGGLPGIDPLALPAGDAPVEVVHDEPVQLRLLLLGEDQHLHRHALPVGPVDGHSVEDGVQRRVDQDGQVKEHSAGDEQRRVEGQVEPPDGGLHPPLGQIQPQQVQPAAAAAAGEGQPRPHPGDHAPQQAAGEHVLHQGRGGNGHDTGEDGVGHGTDEGIAEKHPPHRPVGQNQQGNVEGQQDDPREVEGHGLDAQDHQHQRAQQLAQPHQPPGEQPQGHHEQIDPQRVDQGPRHGHGDPAPAALHGSFHMADVLLLRTIRPARVSVPDHRLYCKYLFSRSLPRARVRETVDLVIPRRAAIWGMLRPRS